MRLRAVCLIVGMGLLLAACSAGARSGQGVSSDSGGSVTVQATKKPALKLIGRFESPIYLTAAPGDSKRQFVVQQTGKVIVVRNGKKLSKPFLDLSAKTNGEGEQGLLSIVFAPDYAKSRKFYVYYTAKSDGGTRVVEYKRSKRSRDRADKKGRLVLKVDQPEANHNGGQLQFGNDGMLYIGLGDGGGGGDEHGEHGNAQDLTSLLGKILRINPKRSGKKAYTVPNDNPFVSKSSARDEIYIYGVRNPWRFSFDRDNDAIVIGDVGQGEREEIDYLTASEAAGANLGWRVYEGTARFRDDETATGAIDPVHEYLHSDGGCSITGGYIVRDSTLTTLKGRYIYGDYCAGEIRSIKLSKGASSDDVTTGLKVESLTSFGEDTNKRLYAMSQTGAVYRIIAR